MAEALAVFGAFSATASLFSDFSHLSIRLNYYARHLKYAKAEIEQVDLEMAAFNFFLENFHETVNRPEARNTPLMQAAIKADLDTKLTRHSGLILDSADRMLYKLKPLRDDKDSSFWRRSIPRLRWTTEKDDVQTLQTSLISVKTSMQLFVSMLNINEKKSEINSRIQNGHDVTKLQAELKNLKKDLRYAQQRCARAEKKLAAQQPHSSVAMPSSSELSHTVEALVKSELERQRQKRRARGSNPSTSTHTSATASALSGSITAVEVPPPFNPTPHRFRPTASDSASTIPMSPIITPVTDEHVRPPRLNPHERGWTPTALSASEPEPRVEIARLGPPQDVVVDDNINPVHVVRRVPRMQPGAGVDGE